MKSSMISVYRRRCMDFFRLPMISMSWKRSECRQGQFRFSTIKYAQFLFDLEATFHLNGCCHFLRFRRRRSFLKWLSVSFWGGSILIGAAFAFIIINLVWQRFELKPTITRVETNFYPIWNVPFPSVTICNINKVYRPATLNITKQL